MAQSVNCSLDDIDLSALKASHKVSVGPKAFGIKGFGLFNCPSYRISYVPIQTNAVTIDLCNLFIFYLHGCTFLWILGKQLIKGLVFLTLGKYAR